MDIKSSKIAIIGAGPAGGILGAYLSQLDLDITLVDVWKAHIKAIKKNGLKISGVAEINAHFDENHLKTSILELKENPPDIVFIAVKTPFLDQVIRDLQKILPKKSYLISHQNGIATGNYVAMTFGNERTFRVVINYAGNLKDKGKIDMTFFNPPNYIGALDESSESVAQAIADLMTESGLTTEFQKDVRPASWKKTILNASLSGLCAVTQMTMREAMDFQQTHYIVSNLIKEGITVAKALGYSFEPDYYDKAVAYLSKGGHHKPSMLVDIENRKPTEVAFLNKKIVEFGQQYNIPVPINEAITSFIEALDFIALKTTNYIRSEVKNLKMKEGCISCIHVKECIDIYAFCPLSGESIPSKVAKMPSFSEIILDIVENIAIIRINTPPSNQLSIQAFVDLLHAIDFISNNETFKACIITATGNRFFASGLDLKNFNEDTIEAINKSSRTAIDALESLELPTIAAVNGYALGGGCEIALATDIRIASENAQFGFPEVKIGIIPGGGGTQRLTKLLGSARASELILTGEFIKSKQALDWGLINRVVPIEKLEETALIIARKIIKNAPLAVKTAKQAIKRATVTDLESGLDYENIMFNNVFRTKDRVEGVSAFLEKRDPKFSGK
ncbi:MAG: 2-dehydropantoate 2-reductase [Candidatus Hodarchaeales archaeon]